MSILQVPAGLAAAPSVEPSSVARAALLPAEQAGSQPPPVNTLTPQKAQLSVDPSESAQRLSDVIDDLNKRIEGLGRNLGFSIDEKVNRSIVTVVNKQTGEVVRQIPTEVVIRVAHSIEDLKGLLFDSEF